MLVPKLLVHTAFTYKERGLLIAPFGRSRFGANGKPIGLLLHSLCQMIYAFPKRVLYLHSTPAKSGHPTNLRVGAPLLPQKLVTPTEAKIISNKNARE